MVELVRKWPGRGIEKGSSYNGRFELVEGSSYRDFNNIFVLTEYNLQ